MKRKTFDILFKGAEYLLYLLIIMFFTGVIIAIISAIKQGL